MIIRKNKKVLWLPTIGAIILSYWVGSYISPSQHALIQYFIGAVILFLVYFIIMIIFSFKDKIK